MATDIYTKEYQKIYNKTPMGAYIRQRSNARARGIDWEFTFETWWEVWEKSGKWEKRGKKATEYCMSRKFDWGPYSPSNVRIVTNSRNTKECNALTGFGEPGLWHGTKSTRY